MATFSGSVCGQCSSCNIIVRYNKNKLSLVSIIVVLFFFSFFAGCPRMRRLDTFNFKDVTMLFVTGKCFCADLILACLFQGFRIFHTACVYELN